MSQESNRFAIGLFVIGALAITIAGIALLGSGLLFRETKRYVTFFDGSVRGLTAGAPVLFRGVHIGEVKQVVLQIDHGQEKVRIPVIYQIYPGSLMEVGERPMGENAVVKRMIEQGLRARLEIQSVVTGALALSLNFYPGSAIKYGGEMPEMSEIPSIPSALDILSDALGDVPLRDIVGEVRTMVSQATMLFKDDDLRRLPRELSRTMEEFRKTSAHLTELMQSTNAQIAPIGKELRETLAATQTAMGRFDKVAGRLDVILSDDSPDKVQLSELLEDLRAASQQVKELAEYLQRNPDALVRGK
jgi:paraquat-inducible protein B